MNTFLSLSFLRRVLLIDAVASGAMGLGLLAMSPLLASLLELPQQLLWEAGIALVPFAAFVSYLASRQQPSRIAVWIVIAVNAIWMIDSIALLLTNWVSPNALGIAFVVVQALVVGVFAQLQYVGLSKRRLAVAE